MFENFQQGIFVTREGRDRFLHRGKEATRTRDFEFDITDLRTTIIDIIVHP